MTNQQRRVDCSLCISVILAVLTVGCICQQPGPLAFVSPLPQQDILPPLSQHAYLPIISGGLPDADATCFGNPKALELYHRLSDDARQQRAELVCNPLLVAAAQARARGLATVDPWAHYDHNGVYAMAYGRAAGCALPGSDGQGTNVESLGAGMDTAARAFQSLVDDSPTHRQHLMGEIDFFREQTQIGIGYEVGSNTYQYYWVVITTPACQ